jgi:hypothetical protein
MTRLPAASERRAIILHRVPTLDMKPVPTFTDVSGPYMQMFPLTAVQGVNIIGDCMAVSGQRLIKKEDMMRMHLYCRCCRADPAHRATAPGFFTP